MREQTVLRRCVAGSEDTGDAAADGGCGHEKDRAVAALGFGEGGVPGGVPGDAGIADGLWAGTEVGRSYALGVERGGGQQRGEVDGGFLEHGSNIDTKCDRNPVAGLHFCNLAGGNFSGRGRRAIGDESEN